MQAVNYWQNNTCIRFEHVIEEPAGDFIEFFKGQGYVVASFLLEQKL